MAASESVGVVGVFRGGGLEARTNARMRFSPPWRRRWRTSRLPGFVRSGEGASALEYAILVGIVAVVLAVALTTFSGNLRTAITNIGTGVGNTTPPSTPDADPT